MTGARGVEVSEVFYPGERGVFQPSARMALSAAPLPSMPATAR